MVIYAADRVANMRDWHKVRARRTGPPAASGSARPSTSASSSGRRTSRSSTTSIPQTPFLAEIESELGALKAEAGPR